MEVWIVKFTRQARRALRNNPSTACPAHCRRSLHRFVSNACITGAYPRKERAIDAAGASPYRENDSLQRVNRFPSTARTQRIAGYCDCSRPGVTPSRSARLRHIIESPGLAFLMEAHNALSARIAQEAGFDAIWAGGLSIAATLGVRDANEASWTQVLETVEFMADATDASIL